MTAYEIKKNFGPKHHALLFALMSREVIRRAGEDKGEQVIRKAVRRYGYQRGRRMALRVKTDGKPLSMFNFLVFGEWAAEEGASSHNILEAATDFHIQVERCPWNEAWVEAGVLPYGRLYCLEVDHALIEGFNPELNLELNATLSNNQRECDFIYHDTNLTPENLKRMTQRKEEVHDRAVMPWDYHLGHLFKTISEVVIDGLGELGKEAMQAAMREFSGEFGKEAAQIVTSLESMDFDELPV